MLALSSGPLRTSPKNFSRHNLINKEASRPNKNAPQVVVRTYRGSAKTKLNVSGVIYETYESTLNKYPITLLGTSEKRFLLLDKNTDQIFINRPHKAFEAVLYYYQSSGRLIRPPNMCMDDFETECYFYEISPKAIKRMKEKENYFFKPRLVMPTEEEFGGFRRSVWLFIEEPTEFKLSCLSLTYFLFSYILIITSIAVFCIETELFPNPIHEEFNEHVRRLDLVEVALNLFFLTELTIRIFVNPWPWDFIQAPLNVTEIASFFAYLIAYPCPDSMFRLWVFRFSRILRTFRLVRLSRWSQLINAASSVVRSAVNEMIAVSFVTFLVCILCGSIMYFIEMEEPDTNFRSIPDSMWWAIQTVLCVGYGDIVPTSVIGKSVGGCVLYIGVVCTTVMLLALGGRIFDMFSKEISNRDFLSQKEEDYEIHYDK